MTGIEIEPDNFRGKGLPPSELVRVVAADAFTQTVRASL